MDNRADLWNLMTSDIHVSELYDSLVVSGVPTLTPMPPPPLSLCRNLGEDHGVAVSDLQLSD